MLAGKFALCINCMLMVVPLQCASSFSAGPPRELLFPSSLKRDVHVPAHYLLEHLQLPRAKLLDSELEEDEELYQLHLAGPQR
jgi:hypothetical protein